jgi:hypothetical protein
VSEILDQIASLENGRGLSPNKQREGDVYIYIEREREERERE